MASPSVAQRKRPRQRRSKVTVEAILDATTQLLVEEGYDKTSTNKVAKRAGVSVGSLYQYFSSKEALVLAVARRHSDEMTSVLAEHVAELATTPIPEAVRTYVRAILEAHAVHPELHRVLVQQVLHLGAEHLDEVQRRARALVRSWLELHRHEIVPTDLDAAALVLVTAVEAVTHGWMLYGRTVDQQTLEDETVALVLRYLGAED